MKRVRHVVFDKNGEEHEQFNPTPRMIIFAAEKSKNPEMGDPDIARLAGLDPASPGMWVRKYGALYLTWLEECIEATAFGKEAQVLEMVGMIEASQGAFSFWKEMARKHGVIQDEVKELTVQVNTNFTTILAGESAQDARRRLLQEIRGLGNGGKPVVVDVTPSENTASPTSTGDRASNVQGGPVALPAALGSNRRRTKRREPIPGVS